MNHMFMKIISGCNYKINDRGGYIEVLVSEKGFDEWKHFDEFLYTTATRCIGC
jgi:hypothetical protein